MERYESLVTVHTSNSIKMIKGENTFICDSKKQADYIK